MKIPFGKMTQVEEFRKSLLPLLEAYKAKITIEIETQNEIYSKNTRGTITQTLIPVHYLTIDCWQSEDHEFIHALPRLPYLRFRIKDVNTTLLEFLCESFTAILSENIPNPEIWKQQ
jgi:hypothetical protein